jgi:hypothetical protein
VNCTGSYPARIRRPAIFDDRDDESEVETDDENKTHLSSHQLLDETSDAVAGQKKIEFADELSDNDFEDDKNKTNEMQISSDDEGIFVIFILCLWSLCSNITLHFYLEESDDESMESSTENQQTQTRENANSTAIDKSEMKFEEASSTDEEENISDVSSEKETKEFQFPKEWQQEDDENAVITGKT